jgi:hypothetical protein
MPKVKRRKGESKAQQNVRSAVTEMNAGKLRSGSKRGPKVTDRKQAIAIGLSEARKAGADVPDKPTKKSAKKTASTRKKASAK